MPKQKNTEQPEEQPEANAQVLTVSQFEKLSEEKRNAFRDAGGTVTNDTTK